MKKKLLSLITVISVMVSTFTLSTPAHADEWILASQLPACAEVTSRKWTYTLTSYKTSSESSLPGWEKYDTKWVWGPWSSWSSWSDTKVTETESRQVETRKVTDKYNYYRYASSKNASTGSYKKSSSYPNKYKYAIKDKLGKSSTTSNPQSYKLYHDKNGNYDKNGTSYHSVWQDDPFETKKTQYRYRTRSKVYTYYYRKNDNLESYSYPSGNNISNITEWVTYTYKSFVLDLNGMLDDVYSGAINGFGTADVYVNGKLVADDVTDYYASHTCGSSYEIKDIKPLYGHSYDGTYASSASGVIYDNTSVILKFHTNSYQVNVETEDNNKGTVFGSGTYLYGSNIEISAQSNPGYHFKNWSGGIFASRYTVNVTEPSTYTAYFEPNSYTVTFVPNGGEVEQSSKSVTFNEPYGSLPIPLRENYKFDGWFTAETGGTKIEDAMIFSTTDNQTLYAQWSEIKHSYPNGWVIDTAPTCENEGSQHRVCSECGETETVKIPATGHKYSVDWIETKKPTCTQEGEKAHICTSCGTVKDRMTIGKTDHSYGDWQVEKEATCTEKGLKYRTCSVCKYKDTQETEMIEHDFILVNDIPPTPLKSGERIYRCSRKECMKAYNEYYRERIYNGVIAVESTTAIVGGIATVTAKLVDNPGFVRFNLKVNYDKEIFTPKSITVGETLRNKGGKLTSNLDQVMAGSISASSLDAVTAVWEHRDLEKDVDDREAELFTVTFDVSSNAPEGDYAISVSYDDIDQTYVRTVIIDCEGHEILPSVIEGIVTTKINVIKGDANLDMVVDSHDSTYLSRKIVGWLDLPWSDYHQKAADLFADGKITPKDGTRLAQLLAGYVDVNDATVQSRNEVSLLADESTQGRIYVANVKGVPGEEIDVPVLIENNPGLSGFNLKLIYDNNSLTPLAFVDGDLYEGGAISNIQQKNLIISDIENVNVCWASNGNIVGNGVLFTVRFKINENLKAGSVVPISLEYTNDDMCKVDRSNIMDVDIKSADGLVEVVKKSPYPFEISEVTIAQNGIQCDSIPQNGDFDVNVEISRLKEYVGSAEVIVATYDEDDKLIKIYTVKADDNSRCQIYVEKCDLTVSKIKAFLWESVNTEKPLAENYTLK